MVLQNALWLGFPVDAAEYLDKIEAKLLSRQTLARAIAAAEDRLFDTATPKNEFLFALAEIARESEIDPRVVDLTVLLHAVDRLRAEYQNRGLPDQLCRETLLDLKYKLEECRAVYGVIGTFVTEWFTRHFRCELFALGRLQYERHPFEYESYGNRLSRGDMVYKCHIPASGPITPESVTESLRIAHAFFQKELKDGILPVFCSSWMLYPPHNERVFKEGSNLNRFFELFDVIEAIPLPENEDFWRIFNRTYLKDAVPTSPENTSLQRAFKRFLLEGNDMGKGKAILLFDGERILTP